MTKRTRRPLGLIDIVIGCLLLAGFGVLCYPFASDAYVSYQNQQVIDKVSTTRSAEESDGVAAGI